jgi:hypothetical protein
MEKELEGLKTKRREIDGGNKCLGLKLNYHNQPLLFSRDI